MTLRAAVPALAILLCLPATAGASTIAGKVAGGKVPKAGKGFGTVRAVGVKDLAITDIAKVRSGRYRLTVPAGSYWLFAATTPFRGKAGVDRSAGIVKLRKGKRKTERVSLRKSKRLKRPKLPKMPKLPKIPGLPTAGAAFVKVKEPAVWVQHFSVSGDPELRVLRKGLADMLITDLMDPIERLCGGHIVEREKFNLILAEIAFSQSPLADPSTRMTTDKIIEHNREVSGSLTVAGGTMTLTVTVKNVVTDTTRSVTRSSAADRFFELEQSVVQETARLICGDKPPAAYSGQISGATSVADNSGGQTISWSGNVRLRFTGTVHRGRRRRPAGRVRVLRARVRERPRDRRRQGRGLHLPRRDDGGDRPEARRGRPRAAGRRRADVQPHRAPEGGRRRPGADRGPRALRRRHDHRRSPSAPGSSSARRAACARGARC